MKHLFIVATLIIGLFSCQSENPTNSSHTGGTSGRLPKANGIAGQVLVSIDTELWEGNIEAIFEDKFSDTAQGPFIYAEHIFDYTQEDPTTINKNRKKNRNFLSIVLDTDKDYTETEVVVKKDYKASGQLYIIFRDSDKQRLEQFLQNELKTYIVLYDMEETERLVNEYYTDNNISFKRTAEEKFGISISIPSSAKFVSNQDSIIYALDKSVDESTKDNPSTGAKGGTYWSQRGILIWESPYLNTDSFNPNSILSLRDTILKQNVKGTIEGSYMATEYASTHKPKLEAFDINGNQAMKIEGLWKHDGNAAASGGGPFIQYSIVHPTRQTIVHISTHIFAPRFNKREYIRQIRAMLQTIQLVD